MHSTTSVTSSRWGAPGANASAAALIRVIASEAGRPWQVLGKLDQIIFALLFFTGIHRFRNSVGEKHDVVTRFQQETILSALRRETRGKA
jgi:hypothetical protein